MTLVIVACGRSRVAGTGGLARGMARPLGAVSFRAVDRRSHVAMLCRVGGGCALLPLRQVTRPGALRGNSLRWTAEVHHLVRRCEGSTPRHSPMLVLGLS